MSGFGDDATALNSASGSSWLSIVMSGMVRDGLPACCRAKVVVAGMRNGVSWSDPFPGADPACANNPRPLSINFVSATG
jgi:hypothetical protein